MRLELSCARWKHWPTSEEFYEAVRVPRPTPRQRLILETWVTEAHWVELIHAWTEVVSLPTCSLPSFRRSF